MVLFCAFLGLYNLCHSHISLPNNATRHTQQNLVNILLFFKSLYISLLLLLLLLFSIIPKI